MASRFWLAAYIARLIDSHFSLVYFSALKYILKYSYLSSGKGLKILGPSLWYLSSLDNCFCWFPFSRLGFGVIAFVSEVEQSQDDCILWSLLTLFLARIGGKVHKKFEDISWRLYTSNYVQFSPNGNSRSPSFFFHSPFLQAIKKSQSYRKAS